MKTHPVILSLKSVLPPDRTKRADDLASGWSSRGPKPRINLAVGYCVGLIKPSSAAGEERLPHCAGGGTCTYYFGVIRSRTGTASHSTRVADG